MTAILATIAAASDANETNGRFIVDDTNTTTHHFPGGVGVVDEVSPSSSSQNNSNSNNINMPINDDHTTAVLSSAMPAVNNKGSGSGGALISSDTDADAHENVLGSAAAAASSSSTSSTPLNQPKAASSSSPISSSTYQSASPPSQNQQQQNQEQLLDETKIQKAIAFLHNPTIRDVSNTNKRIYLERNTDLNKDEIDAAMGRIKMMEHNGGSGDGGGVNVRDTGGSSSTDDIRGRGGHQQHKEWQNQRHDDQYNHHQHTRGNPLKREDDYHWKDNYADFYGARRHQPPLQPPPSPHVQGNDYYSAGNTLQRQEHDPHYREDDLHYVNDHPQHHHRALDRDGGGFATVPGSGGGGGGGGSSSWLGGFSLGILGLATWRWLNGGDFVLFPPPSIMFSTSTATTTTTSDLVNDDGTKSVAVAAKTRGLPSCPEEEEEEEGNDDENENQGDDEEESEEEDNDENEYEEDEFLASHDLHAILNHKNAHSRCHSHPSNNTSVQQQPSYDELVLEIRALTSAIHSHRDSQERSARNAYNSNVGKGMTDDAMDFLRKKKEGTKQVEVSKSENDQLNVVASLLKEVSGDLNDLKQSMKLMQRQSSATEERSTEEETGVDVEGPTIQIDLVMGKIQKMLAIVDENPNVNEEENIVTLENGNNNSDGAGDDGDYIGTVEEGDEMFMSASTVSEVDQLNAFVVASESIVAKEVADAANTEESEGQQSKESCETSQDNLPEQPEQQQQYQLKQLEDALRTLANNNDAQSLKVGAQMLYLYCRNIFQNASVPRYRKIYTNNNTFRTKVGNLVGAKDFLMAVGFVEHAKENLFEWSEQQACGGGSGNVDTEAIKSKLDFALVALELMKNGSAGADVDGDDQRQAK